jgi:hypothetical protein
MQLPRQVSRAYWGTGNVSDTPLLEKTNGACGWAMSVPPQGLADRITEYDCAVAGH